MKIYSLHLNELRDLHPIVKWLDLLPKPMVNEVRSYLKEGDQWRSLGGKLLLKFALQQLGSRIKLSEINMTEKGRPYFEQTHVDFNLSHSGDRLLFALTSKGKCGVDIERERKVSIDLFKSKFTKGEWSAIISASNPQRIFFKAWAVKESVIKADGRGVAVLGKTEILSGSKAVCDGRDWWYQALSIEEGYAASIALETEQPLTILTVRGHQLEAL